MTPTFWALAPLLSLAAGAVGVLLVICVRRSPGLVVGLTLGSLAVALAALATGPTGTVLARSGDLLAMDRFARVFAVLLLSASLLTVLMTTIHGRDLRPTERRSDEFYALLLLATLGAVVLVACTHAATLVLGLETLSISLYAMIAYQRRSRHALEAALKYLVLASASAAFLFFGLALLYAATGALNFARWRGAPDLAFAIGAVLTLTGIGFKLAVVPFHLWTPDVYQGAPSPVAAFVATVSKGAVAALLLRYAALTGALDDKATAAIVSVVAILSMLAGNLLALLQVELRRLLAFSSIAHLGYVLVALKAGGAAGAQAVGFYLAAYFAALLAAFGVLTVTRQPGRETVTPADLRGLAWRRPVAGLAMTTALLSLAGLPLTGGFMGKLYIVHSGVKAGEWALIGALVLGSAIGIYYYLRVIVVLYADGGPPPRHAGGIGKMSARWPDLYLAAVTLLSIWLGTHPAPSMQLLDGIAPGDGAALTPQAARPDASTCKINPE